MMSIGQKVANTRNDFDDKPLRLFTVQKKKTPRRAIRLLRKVQGILWYFIFYVADLVSQ